ncbi:MAG TPA: ferritin family protein [bacterium]|jgi:rubrerythrin|nr:ferritin family protein [bacterium]HOZ22113.1 ferritin family protein [bacterium]
MNKIGTLSNVDALKMAIQCKMDMKLYYDRAATLIKNDDATAILLGLAAKEEAHRLQLIRKYSSISGKKILYLNLGKKHKLGTLIPCGDDPNEAIRNTKKNETEIKNFFITVSRRMYQSDMRMLFREIALEEEQHIVLLESSFCEPLNLDQPAERNDEGLYREIADAKNVNSTW